MGLIFCIAAWSKLFEPPSTAGLVYVFGLPYQFMPAELIRIVRVWLPYIELVVGALMIVGIAPRFMSIIALALIAAFILTNSLLISRGLGTSSCGCFGGLVELTTIQALYIDIIMLVLTVVIFFSFQGKLITIRTWFAKMDKPDSQ